MIKVVKYQNEKFEVIPTAVAADKIYVQVKNGLMFIEFHGVVIGLKPALSTFYQGTGLKYATQKSSTTGFLIAAGRQFGFAGVTLQDGNIYVNASDSPPTPVELHFTIIASLI